MKKLLTALLLTCLLPAAAQNPIIRNQFTADPTARVFNGKVYLYPSHDIHAPEGQRQDWFCMADYHVFSSDNLTEWTDHGVIVSQENVPWGNPTGYSMWAPDCVYKNGTYYFYFPNAPKSGRGFAVGVATAKQPEGPFTCEPEPIKGVSGIDPCVLIDDDGQAYIYWSGMGIRGARLKDNMKEIMDEDFTEMQMRRPNNPNANNANNANIPNGPIRVAGKTMEGLPDGFKEGPYAFKRDGHYYLTFPWVRKENGTETLAYAMSDNPLGPWDFKGIIMAEHDNGCWTNHHSIMEYKGEWLLFYHRNYYSPSMDKRRSACIERVQFNADGTIQEVHETLRGVGINQASDQIQIDRYSEVSNGMTAEYLDTANCFRGWFVNLPAKGSWVRYNGVDFSATSNAYLVIRTKANANTSLCIREGKPTGKVIAKVALTVAGENGPFRRNLIGQWLTLTAPLEYVPKGVTDLYITCEGEAVSIDWVQFKNRPEYFTSITTPTAKPDEDGFIRRWLLLEPIDKPNRSNTVFTDTYLREHFYKTYFKDQFTIVPKDGQKVTALGQRAETTSFDRTPGRTQAQPELKTVKQTLTWHALDSKNYNVKLFRFADMLDKTIYGVLFWAVTVIDCPEDIPNVRLSVGSNSASMWWLNGEEALLLSGDRRMVRDDAMSPRLNLKKGRNILRGAIINGPGMSDFCVRFLDEKGQPVTNYTINLNK